MQRDPRSGNGEAGSEVVEETDFELGAGLGEAEHDVAGVAAIVRWRFRRRFSV